MRRAQIAAAAPPAASASTSEATGVDIEAIDTELEELPFKPFFVTKSEMGRRRASFHFIIIVLCIVFPSIVAASFANELIESSSKDSINYLVWILEIICVLFIYLGIRLLVKFFQGVQSVEIGYDPENDTKLLIRHKRCLPLHIICCPCIKYFYTTIKTKDIIDQDSITSLICAKLKHQSEGSRDSLYIIELETQNGELKCRIEETTKKSQATRIVNEMNKSLNKHEKYRFEAMVDYA